MAGCKYAWMPGLERIFNWKVRAHKHFDVRESKRPEVAHRFWYKKKTFWAGSFHESRPHDPELASPIDHSRPTSTIHDRHLFSQHCGGNAINNILLIVRASELTRSLGPRMPCSLANAPLAKEKCKLWSHFMDIGLSTHRFWEIHRRERQVGGAIQARCETDEQ